MRDEAEMKCRRRARCQDECACALAGGTVAWLAGPVATPIKISEFVRYAAGSGNDSPGACRTAGHAFPSHHVCLLSTAIPSCTVACIRSSPSSPGSSASVARGFATLFRLTIPQLQSHHYRFPSPVSIQEPPLGAPREFIT